jgi:hypothetical protein
MYRERRRVVRAHARGDYTEQPNNDVLIEVLHATHDHSFMPSHNLASLTKGQTLPLSRGPWRC